MSEIRYPFQLRPLPEEAGNCPRCLRPLMVAHASIAGWRNLVRGRCPDCGHTYLQDLPSGHGLIYPASLDITTGETFDESGATWFSSRLGPLWTNPDDSPVAFDVQGHSRRDRAVLLNCLDPIYGHSVLKLLNAQRELQGDANLIVLVPESLLPLVPAGVAETWIVREPSSRFNGWLLDLELLVHRELEFFQSCTLSPAFPHPHPSTYDLDAILDGITPESQGRPSILLSVRSDRSWGATPDDQLESIEILAKRIVAAHPDAQLSAIGIGASTPLPQVVGDFRSSQSNAETERRWIALSRGADLLIGVHGSNMLVPSGLAKATIELVPRSRYGNYVQSTLFGANDAAAALFRHRAVYGAEDLSDVSAELVSNIAISILSELPRFGSLMLGQAAGVGTTGSVATIAASWSPGPEKAPKHTEHRRIVRQARRTAVRSVDAVSSAFSRRRLRNPSPPVVLTDALGSRFELETREEIDAFIRHRGHFEQAELRRAQVFATGAVTVLDIGANIGAFTATLARADLEGRPRPRVCSPSSHTHPQPSRAHDRAEHP